MNSNCAFTCPSAVIFGESGESEWVDLRIGFKGIGRYLQMIVL